jgi:hypothetical protein
MADSSVAVNVAGGGSAPVDTATQAGGDHRQVVCVGDATNTYTGKVDSGGNLAVRQAPSASATSNTRTMVANTAQDIHASTAGRVLATVYNGLAVDLYVLLGTPATVTAFTLIVPPGGYYEVPPVYTGAVSAIASAAGSVYVTQVVSP